MSENRTHSLGRRGERAAMRHLQGKGFRWVASNVRTRWGEIDLVMKEGSVLVFVEVKTREKDDSFGEPEEAITKTKQSHIIKGALEYLQTAGAEDQPIRFDVVTIGSFGIRHYPDAFGSEGNFYY